MAKRTTDYSGDIENVRSILADCAKRIDDGLGWISTVRRLAICQRQIGSIIEGMMEQPFLDDQRQEIMQGHKAGAAP